MSKQRPFTNSIKIYISVVRAPPTATPSRRRMSSSVSPSPTDKTSLRGPLTWKSSAFLKGYFSGGGPLPGEKFHHVSPVIFVPAQYFLMLSRVCFCLCCCYHARPCFREVARVKYRVGKMAAGGIQALCTDFCPPQEVRMRYAARRLVVFESCSSQ
jgi:hypothetical protein